MSGVSILKLATLVVLAVLCSACGADAAAAHFVEVQSAEYRWGTDSSVPYRPLPSMLREPPDRSGATELHVRFVMPDTGVDDPAIRTSMEMAEGHVGGRTLAPYPRLDFLLPVDRQNVGSTIDVVFRGRGRLSPEGLTAGSERALLIDAFLVDAFQFTVGATFVVVGLLLLLASLSRKGTRAYRWMGLFLFPLGFILVDQATAYSSLFFGRPALGMWLNCLALMIFPIGIARFAEEAFGDTKHRWLTRISWMFVVLAVVSVVLDLTGLVPIRVTKRIATPLELVMSAIALRVAWAKRQKYTARLFLGGFGTLLVLAVPDILWGLGYPLFVLNTIPFALLAFAIAMTLVVERTFRDKAEALAQSSIELSRRVEDLERNRREIEGLNDELRHQVETRSRDLRTALTKGGVPVPFASREVAVGDLVGDRYRVDRHIGSGAMGAVYEVERRTDKKHFALKMMTGPITGMDAARFAREAEMAAQARHENLVAIVDVGIGESNIPYLVMELVVGKTLEQSADLFGQVRRALPILRDVANGLAALHRRGVVHRDLKPANILLERSETGIERAKIADFGIAREGDEDAPVSISAETIRSILASTQSKTDKNKLTQTGALVGTPFYMAPEAAHGRSSTPAADVFAFGLVAHEVLTGRRPYDPPAIMQALAGQTLPRIEIPQTLRLDLELAVLLERSLSSDPHARPTAAELARILTIVVDRASAPEASPALLDDDPGRGAAPKHR
jgi:serine/threonine-protein kinase